MCVQPGEIYWAQLQYGTANDLRPCIVLEDHKATVSVVRISSALDLHNPLIHFWIDEQCPDFVVTGLRKTCFCDGSKIFEISTGRLGKRLGQLERGLARDFRTWMG